MCYQHNHDSESLVSLELVAGCLVVLYVGVIVAGVAVANIADRTAVESLTVALQVPNHHHARSILHTLNVLSVRAKTDSEGRLALLSAVVLELLRRQDSLQAATTQCKVCDNPDEAQCEFSRRSIVDRSKIAAEKGMVSFPLVFWNADFISHTRAFSG
jgi:Protein of unknown function (DUF1517)